MDSTEPNLANNKKSIVTRLWLYQSERFPLFGHGLLILAFSLSAVCYSALLRQQTHFPPSSILVAAFFSALIFFLLLRIADEFKDFEEDAQYRPYRAVPRGLVSLQELARVAGLVIIIQAIFAISWHKGLLLLLMAVWVYLFAMSHEFGIKRWLKAHPFTYMWSHMLIMPLIDLYATSWDWILASGSPPDGLFWFLLLSFFNGIVIEVGRKIRAPESEETGVETYSVLWGINKSVTIWLISLVLTAFSAWMAALNIGFALPVLILLLILLGVAVILAAKFIRNPTPTLSKGIENYSGIWTIVMYTSLGLLPMTWIVLGH